jgi:hypothetical protein
MNFSKKTRRPFLGDFAQAAKRIGKAATDLSSAEKRIGAEKEKGEQ